MATVVGVAGACGSDDNGPTGLTAADLVGTYTLTSFALGGQTDPGATGSLALTDTRYDLQLNLSGQDPIVDEGTWTLNGTTFTQTSDNGLPSLTGTVTLTGNTLSISGSEGGVPVATTWQKQ